MNDLVTVVDITVDDEGYEGELIELNFYGVRSGDKLASVRIPVVSVRGLMRALQRAVEP